MPDARRGPVSLDDAALVTRLRRGDEQAFAVLVELHTASLLRVARQYVRSRAIAEDVVQETWLGVLNGIDGFERRCSLKNWIFKILVNTAASRGARERRCIPFSALVPADEDATPAPKRAPAAETPEERALAGERRATVRAAILRLPPAQRTVIALRDVEGWPASEVCELLGLSEAYQRVLLHRARTKVRGELERYFAAFERSVKPAA